MSEATVSNVPKNVRVVKEISACIIFSDEKQSEMWLSIAEDQYDKPTTLKDAHHFRRIIDPVKTADHGGNPLPELIWAAKGVLGFMKNRYMRV